MQRAASFVLFTTLGLQLIGCTTGDRSVDLEVVREQLGAYHSAYEANDVDAIVAFYVDRAMRLPADGSIIRGVSAIRDRMVAARADNDFVLDDLRTTDVQLSGDLAVTLSTFDERQVSKSSGETTRQVGQWLVLWQRQSDDTWKITKEMWTIQEQ